MLQLGICASVTVFPLPLPSLSLSVYTFFACFFVDNHTQKVAKNLVTVCVHKVLWLFGNINHFIPVLASNTQISRFACFLVFPGYVSGLKRELE